MQSSTKRSTSIIAAEYLRELESEVRATRECLEQVPMDQADWKPHEKSMPLNYLAMMVAEIPKWITYTIEKSEIDFGTFEHAKISTTEELVAAFDQNMVNVRKAIKTLTDEGLKETFALKNKGELLFSSPKDESISQSINHLVHHRGQLTVYLKMLDKKIPSIYGPSADSGGF
ncbi:MAG: damage-inducible protein DinB [Acidobacteria bacterium]|nr:MAG: damage-inducible protein DinB [Acidobacteriota bacterium]